MSFFSCESTSRRTLALCGGGRKGAVSAPLRWYQEREDARQSLSASTCEDEVHQRKSSTWGKRSGPAHHGLATIRASCFICTESESARVEERHRGKTHTRR